jgi:hypothetical protein
LLPENKYGVIVAKALTARSVDQVRAASNRLEIPDGLLPGLYLIVQPSGTKSWAIRYRYGGRTRKLTLGKIPALSLGDARKLGRDALLTVAKGIDPAAKKIQARFNKASNAGCR